MTDLTQLLWIAIPAMSSAAYGLLFLVRRQELGSVSRWFSAYLAAASFWSLGSMLLHANLGIVNPVWLARLVMFGNFAMPLTIYGFTVHYLSLPRQQSWIPIWVLFYAVFGILNLLGFVVVDTQVNQGLVENRYGWGLALVGVFWSLCFYPSIFLLVREVRRSEDAAFRNRLKYLIITFVLFLAGSLLNASPQLAAYPIDHLVAGTTAVLISLSISRYQLLEVQHVVKRSAILILGIVLYLAAVSGAFYVLAGLDKQLLLPVSVAAAAVTALVILSYRPVRQGIVGFIERVFLPERYNVHALIFAISRLGNRLRSPTELGTDILGELSRALRCERADLFLEQGDETVYRRVATIGSERIDSEVAFPSDSPLIQELAVYRSAMHVDRLQELSRLRALWIDEWQILRQLQTAVLVPVVAEAELIGFLALGAKTGGEPYTRRELQQTLPLLANQMSIALANSRLYVQEQMRANLLAQANMNLRQAQEALQASAERIRREAARAGALVRIADRLNAQLDLATVLSAVCEETARAVNVPAVSVSLYTEKGDMLYPAASVGLSPEHRSQMRAIPRAAYERLVQPAGVAIVELDAQAQTGFPDVAPYLDPGARAVGAVSMMREGELVGCLNVFAMKAEECCGDDELAFLKGIAAQAAQAIVNARLFADAQRRLRNVEVLHEADVAITGGLDLHGVFTVVLDGVMRQLDVDAADILMPNAQTRALEYVSGRGFYDAPARAQAACLDPGDAAVAVRERRLVQVTNQSQRGVEHDPSWLDAEGFTAYFGMPLIAKNQVRGVLEVFHRTTLDPAKEWLSFLEALASQAAIAIDNNDLFTGLQKTNAELSLAYESTLEGWARALELRDQETEGHTRRVTEMTVRLARMIGVAEENIVHIRRGAILHDIGKMGIPDSILLKPGGLTTEEWKIMRQHPLYAQRLLSAIPFLYPALDIPHYHHEKWDGTGYPRGLKGEDIPLWARIFAVVDVWDALRSKRPYHESWPDEEVRVYLLNQSGSHFDPHIVDVFLQIPLSEWGTIG